MGHEMAHVLLKHNEKAQKNTAVGMVKGKERVMKRHGRGS